MMDVSDRHDLADTIGADAGRRALLEEIVAKVGKPDPAGTDDDLDLWWGLVEIDRLASGLTLAAIARLAEPGSDDPAGPWLRKSDPTGDAPTRLTPEGREVIRRLDAADGAGPQGTAA